MTPRQPYQPYQPYPGKFRVIDYESKEKPVSGSGKQLKGHETYHSKLQEVATSQWFGI